MVECIVACVGEKNNLCPFNGLTVQHFFTVMFGMEVLCRVCAVKRVMSFGIQIGLKALRWICLISLCYVFFFKPQCEFSLDRLDLKDISKKNWNHDIERSEIVSAFSSSGKFDFVAKQGFFLSGQKPPITSVCDTFLQIITEISFRAKTFTLIRCS